MKIQIASDLHLEQRAGHMPSRFAFQTERSRDVLVLAGDIGRETQAHTFIRRELNASPVIYVPGNHEYYSERSHEQIDADWRAIAAEHDGLHYLTGADVEIDGTRFYGLPWYSDLWGTTDPWDLATAHNGAPDFWEPNNAGGEWTISNHIRHNRVQSELLAMQAGKVDVVITHWPPTKEAIHQIFKGDALNPYFINDREDLVREIGAKLWISGHTHEAYDYRIGATRCIGNPSGYTGEYRQNRLFRADKVVEVER